MISIHALREEGDKIDKDYTGKEYGFLSTPSVRRATLIQQRVGRVREFLSTPSVRRATSTFMAFSTSAMEISIHALREEGDHIQR